MIVVLCDSFSDEKESFAIFLDYLEWSDPLSIYKVYYASYTVETTDNLRFLFTDYQYQNEIEEMAKENGEVLDFTVWEEFFEGIDEWYWGFYGDGERYAP